MIKIIKIQPPLPIGLVNFNVSGSDNDDDDLTPIAHEMG